MSMYVLCWMKHNINVNLISETNNKEMDILKMKNEYPQWACHYLLFGTCVFAYRRNRWHRHLWTSDLTPFPTDGVIEAYKLSPGPKTHVSKELCSGLEALRARCEGPREGPHPSQADPKKNLHITEGALTGHRHLQGFEKTEWKSEEKEKSEMV